MAGILRASTTMVRLPTKKKSRIAFHPHAHLATQLPSLATFLHPKGEHIHRRVDCLLILAEAATNEYDIVRYRDCPCNMRFCARQSLPLIGEG